MADGTEVVVESKAAPELQKQAEAMGWIPPTRFKGDPERFIDADAYIKRGEEVLPIVKEHNRRLQNELEAVKAANAKTEAALAAAQKAIDEINERHTVATQKAVEDARKQLKAQLAAASEAGDHEAIAELTDQMIDLNAADKAPKAAAKKEEPAAPQAFVPPPEMKAWNEENPWFGTDKRKTALALGIAQELREAGDRTQGRVFYDKITVEMDKMFGGREPPVDKVEGGKNGSDNEPRSGSKKTYAHLPAEAKAACDADARNFVGPNKKYKTAAEWRTRYAEIYFEEK